MPQLLDLPNELLRAIADELNYLPSDHPRRRAGSIAAFRLTNRRLAEVGKLVFRNFSAIRECPLLGHSCFNFTVQKYLRLVPRQPEFIRLIKSVHLSEAAISVPYLLPKLVHDDPTASGRYYTPAYETITSQLLADSKFLSDTTEDLPEGHCLKPGIADTFDYEHHRSQTTTEWRFTSAAGLLEMSSSALLLRQLSWLRSLSIAGLHIEHLLQSGPEAWEVMHLPLWPCLDNLAITPTTDFDSRNRGKRWDCNYLILLLLAAPKLKNLVAGGFYSPGGRRRKHAEVSHQESEPWPNWNAGKLDSLVWKGEKGILSTLEFIGSRIDGPWLTWFLSRAAVTGLKSFRYSDEHYTSKANALRVLEVLHSSTETRWQLEDLKLESYHGYQCQQADAVKMQNLLRGFPKLRKFATNYRVLLPKADGPLGELSWKGVFNGKLRFIKTPRAKTQRREVYDDGLVKRWFEVADGFRV